MKTNIKKRKKWVKTHLTTKSETDDISGHFLILNKSGIQNHTIDLSEDAVILEKTIYLDKQDAENEMLWAKVEYLGSEYPSDVEFSFGANTFKDEKIWEEVVINGNYFAKFTKWYKKPIFDGDELTGYEIANYKKDEDFVLYDCFKDKNGKELPYVLIGRYFMGATATSQPTTTPQPLAPNTARSRARSLGNGYQLFDIGMYCFWRDLAVCMNAGISYKGGSDFLGLKQLDYDNGQNVCGGCGIDGMRKVRVETDVYAYFISNNPDDYSARLNFVQLPYCVNSGLIGKIGYDPNNKTISLPSYIWKHVNVEKEDYEKYFCAGTGGYFPKNKNTVDNFWFRIKNTADPRYAYQYNLFGFNYGANTSGYYMPFHRLCYKPIEE